MTYRLAIRADQDVAEILRWSAGRHGVSLAFEYVDALYDGFARIAERPDLGNGIGRHGLLWRLLTPGEGHVAIYRVRADDVEIVRVFHTRQNWAPRARRLR